MRINTTLVINSKGGSGKTTVTTNLASYFAARNIPTTIMDYDPQGSCLNWLRLRPTHATRIHGANAAHQRGGRLRSVEMHVPAETRQLIIDAPAGASGLLLQEMLARAHCILIPVAPSAIDIHATANFIRDLLLAGKIRARDARVSAARAVSQLAQPRVPHAPRRFGRLRQSRRDRGGDLRAGRLDVRRRVPGVHADRRVGRRRAKTPGRCKGHRARRTCRTKSRRRSRRV